MQNPVRWLSLVAVSAVLLAGCGGSDAGERAQLRALPEAADAATSRELQEVLDFQRESYGATGMAASIVIGGLEFWSGGSGLANRKTKAPMTAETPFPLSRALPDWPDADRITLRTLLNQTSGVGNDQSRLERETEARPRAIWTPEKTLSYARRKPHRAPGESWEYNGANFVLAGLMIERATEASRATMHRHGLESARPACGARRDPACLRLPLGWSCSCCS